MTTEQSVFDRLLAEKQCGELVVAGPERLGAERVLELLTEDADYHQAFNNLAREIAVAGRLDA